MISKRDKKLVELDQLLRRPRNDRVITFGKNLAKIEFRNKKSDLLTVSGSARGVALSGSEISLDGTINIVGGAEDVGTIVNNFNNYGISLLGGGTTTSNIMMVSTSKNQSIAVAASDIKTGEQSLKINADNKYLFLGAGDDLRFVHDGTNSYIENTTGKLIISSSLGTVTIVSNCNVAGTGVGAPIGTFVDGQGEGEKIKLGSFDSGVANGNVVMLYNGQWYKVDRSDSSGVSGSLGILGVAMATRDSAENGLVLLKGLVRVDSSLMVNFDSAAADIGMPVYLSTTGGKYDMHVSTTSGDIVRIVGHMVDTATDHLIYFNPSNDWVEVS